jgi:hypothetical protein
MITGVAIRHRETLDLWVLPKPNRHHTLLHRLAKHIPDIAHGDLEQGFVDDERRFYDRTEAATHAIKCGQVKELHTPPWLFSEDLW